MAYNPYKNRNQNDNPEGGHEQGSNQRYAKRRDHDRKWDEGNFFHTGPSPRGAQDQGSDRRPQEENRRSGSYNQGQNAHLKDHYGSRSDSSYRNERSFIDHGDHGRAHYQHEEIHNMRRPQTPGGAPQGNQNDVSGYQNDPWREGPGSGSRYKEDDFRYGSGSHNWYSENRYTPDRADERRHNRQHDDRGIMNRVKDTWNDIWHSDDRNYQPRPRYQSNADRVDSHKRYGFENYRDRDFDRGHEGGPRWADESDKGRDRR
ncbi:hypothetical protein MKJ04_11625 [Pontibacter sp. E15-1]|uniref:hypothetical protein n=1 Tax=Pontibacter sp. E15-1 TaxID=2919918 RepID=UPI001F502FA4|nr:hypothetical protein [Pontibacter sp. E15-1]MCJ8165493.1 hypothetical protein [Pontibacter sp. E15-1]